MEYIMISVKICVAELVAKKYFLSHIDGLAQDRHNSNANALEPRPSRTNPSIWDIGVQNMALLIMSICWHIDFMYYKVMGWYSYDIL